MVADVNRRLAGSKVTGHDVHCVRKAHAVDTDPNFFYKPQFSSPQYSEAFAQWMIDQYRADGGVFQKSRDVGKKRDS
ncbi:MAG TPA: hypothetical protein VMV69_22135 [Pirellulales bacterium]|nr:hypothetical protein [Pirellulales bacterium]